MLIENLYKENIEKNTQVLCKEIDNNIASLYKNTAKDVLRYKPLIEKEKDVLKEIFLKTYIMYLKDNSSLDVYAKDYSPYILESLKDLELIGINNILNKSKLNFERNNNLEKEILFFLIQALNFETINPKSFLLITSYFLDIQEQKGELKVIENIITRKEKDNSDGRRYGKYTYSYKEFDILREGYISIMKDNLNLIKEVIESAKLIIK